MDSRYFEEFHLVPFVIRDTRRESLRSGGVRRISRDIARYRVPLVRVSALCAEGESLFRNFTALRRVCRGVDKRNGVVAGKMAASPPFPAPPLLLSPRRRRDNKGKIAPRGFRGRRKVSEIPETEVSSSFLDRRRRRQGRVGGADAIEGGGGEGSSRIGECSFFASRRIAGTRSGVLRTDLPVRQR